VTTHILSEHLLTPFFGSEKTDSVNNDTFNYFLSQLRIRIEMAFGLLVTKWRILSGTPLSFTLKNVSKTIMCCARLHNFCINQRELPSSEIVQDIDKDIITFYQQGNNGQASSSLGYIPSDNTYHQGGPSISFMRNEIVENIKQRSLGRPAHNIQRMNSSNIK